jgi:hypothetical protein
LPVHHSVPLCHFESCPQSQVCGHDCDCGVFDSHAASTAGTAGKRFHGSSSSIRLIG